MLSSPLVVLNTTLSTLPRQWRLSSERVVFIDESWVERLDAPRADLLRRLRATTRGPGALYLVKAFLPWLLPHEERVTVLDFDLLLVHPLSLLEREFKRFDSEQLIGVAADVMASRLYPSSAFGVNGGVQLLRLDRMRLGPYEAAVRDIALSADKPIGYLGDQTLYTHIADLHPRLVYRLSCRFNRQLNTHFHMSKRSYACQDGCAVLHGNQAWWKPHITRWQNLTSTGTILSELEAYLPPHIKPAFADCLRGRRNLQSALGHATTLGVAG